MARALSDLQSVVQTANDIRVSIDNWYKISGQMKLFYDQLRRLSNDHQIWEGYIKNFGLSNDEFLLHTIREAQAALDEEKQKLFGKDGHPRFSSKIKLWFFPAKLESSIQKVITFCEDLSRFSLTRAREIEALARQRALHRLPSFSFTADRRYVPLIEMEEKVKKELRGEHSTVLLYGGSGTGKSALARNLALHFQQAAKERGRGQLSGSSQSYNSSGALFERVLYLECGPEVSLEVKQKELVQLLDPSSSNYDTTDVDPNGKSLSTTSLLSSLLKERSLLIILDDVWKYEKKPEGVLSKEWPSFLKGMIRRGGNHVKWLITSQSRHLCDQMDMEDIVCPVGMEPIKSIDARRIFASLTRLKESDILGVQDVMDRIIDKIDANLLALTCVASNMSMERNKDKEEWKRLESELIATLKSENSIQIQGIHGPSYWAAIKFGWERLTPSQQYLLCLMQICSGPSVPSGVIEYFFQQTRQQNCRESFSNARNELEGKQLLTVRRIPTIIMSEVEESWSIHDLLRRFIGEVLEASVDSMISTFAEKRSASKLEFDVLINAAYLYFNEDCRKQLANKVAELPKMSHLADLQKRILSPITKLLAWVDGEQSTPSLRSSCLQVILKYINHGIFEEVHTSNLLNLSESQAAMLVALMNSVFEEHHPPIGQQITSTLLTLLERFTALVTASSPNHDSARDVSGLLSWTPYILAKSFKQNENKNIATYATDARFQTILDRLTSGLLRTDEINKLCATTLANLACGGDDVKVKMIDVPSLLQNLVTAMGRDDSPDCQAEAARALCNLATSKTKLQIVDFSGVLEALRAGLENTKNVKVQKRSAWTVANLASSNDEVRSKIVVCEGVFRKLVPLMIETDNHDVNKQCARALANLACESGDDVKVKMIEVPSLLKNLVTAMGKDDSSDCQAQAARALCNLANSKSSSQIADFSGVLEALRAGLENTKNVQLQEKSAWTVANLARSNDEVKSKIMGCEGVFRKLVSLMIETDNHDVNKQCARALANLAYESGDDVKVKMIEVPSLLQNLVTSMGRDDSSDCQAEAARALCALANSKSSSQIADFSGVLEALQAGLENTKNVQLQKISAWTVANLAISSDEVRSKIMAYEGVFRKLVSLMIETDNHDVNKQCASAVANLAFGGDGVLRKMMAIFPEIVDVLADAMAKADTRTSSGLEDGMFALTILSPTSAKQMELDSAVAYSGRARGELMLGLYEECLKDCDSSLASLNNTTTETPNDLYAKRSNFKRRCCAKAKLGDFQGALADADSVIRMAEGTEWELAFALQERGVVKCMMNDFSGALVDLDASSSIDEEDDYEVLKHRGFVKFRLQDEEGARADAERALRCKPNNVDDQRYTYVCLGASSVHYLNFELR